MPIDIPKFPLHMVDIAPSRDWMFWKFQKLTNTTNGKYDITELNEKISQQYPELVDWFKFFPYRSIRNIKFNEQKTMVRDHIDFVDPQNDVELFNNNKQNEPCGYRVLVKGSRYGKLYVINSKGQKIYVNMPDDTDVYVLNHTSGIHGVDDEPGRQTLFTHFEIDNITHSTLLLKSFEKYRSEVIFDS